MRRVLIVSPNFPPVNAPDHQRVRMALPHLEENGWTADVLAVVPEESEGVRDELLLQTIPSSIQVRRVRPLSRRWTRFIGWRTVGMRCLPAIGREGASMLREKQHDAVFFSTTMFPVMSLGPSWKQRFGVPYILDFQDPWLTDYYDRPGAPPPPGGRVKYEASRMVARILEPPTVRQADHILCVSPSYPSALMRRHPSLRQDQFTVMPFGAPEADFELLARQPIAQSAFDPSDGMQHWASVGVITAQHRVALRPFFAAVARHRAEHPAIWQRRRLHFIGTSYARTHAEPSVLPVAREFSQQDIVEESVSRVPYLEALQIMRDADRIMMFGTDDPTYTASKIYPCLLAGRPIIAVFHESSSAVAMLRQCGVESVVPVSPDGSEQAPAERLYAILSAEGVATPLNAEFMEQFTARAMTRRLCGIFDSVSLGRLTPS